MSDEFRWIGHGSPQSRHRLREWNRRNHNRPPRPRKRRINGRWKPQHRGPGPFIWQFTASHMAWTEHEIPI